MTPTPAIPKAEIVPSEKNAAAPNLTALSVDQINGFAKVFYAAGTFKDVKSQAEALVKILAGQEMGITPVQSMVGIHMVDGKPALSASLVGSLVKRSGRYNFIPREQNDTVCTIQWWERWDGEWQEVGMSEYTRLEAEHAGLLQKSGGSWAKYGEDMLFARALTRGARRFCPDVFGGAVYTPDEAKRPDDAEDYTEDRQRFVLPSVPRSADAGDAHTSVVDDPDQPPPSGPAASARGGGASRRVGAPTAPPPPPAGLGISETEGGRVDTEQERLV